MLWCTLGCGGLTLNRCSPVALDNGAHLHLHDYLDQALVRVEWCHLENDLVVDHLRPYITNSHSLQGIT
jgi:hypothetical protein